MLPKSKPSEPIHPRNYEKKGDVAANACNVENPDI
jgi:hypothetical protein